MEMALENGTALEINTYRVDLSRREGYDFCSQRGVPMAIVTDAHSWVAYI
ncbi:MAG: hypothetical protein Q9N34_00535 [Aquificota bacterium]|nr:hypothetical protein [Aquificota bacterium]